MQELDILFLNLHRRYLNVMTNHGGFLGIYLLAAFVRQEGFEAKSFSGSLVQGLKKIDELCTQKKISMIGLYCDYENVTENIFLSSYIKEKYNLPVIVGGPQATALEENFFIESKCDAVVNYEGELTVLELMNFFLEDVGELENILGITYRTADGLKKNLNRPLIQNLDALPFIDENCYLEPKYFYSGLSVLTGRGCPFHCAFCYEGSHTKQVRFRSVENVLAEIEIYLKKYDGEEDLYFLFNDDTFTLSTERLKNICEGLAELKKKYEFSFFCEGHVHTIYKNPEMIRYLFDAGCIRLQLGIEAGTEKILNAYGKNTTPKEIFEVVKKCRDVGIREVYGNIILGGAYFSREVFEADKKFVRELLKESRGVLEIGVITYWPLHGTPMTLHPENFGIKICDDEFITSVGDFPQIETAEIDRLEILEMQAEFQKLISKTMSEMLENWEVPTERILSWFPKVRHSRHYGMWFNELRQNEILFSYYDMIKFEEGFHSTQIENLSSAIPMRVATLQKNLKRVDKTTAEFFGEVLHGKELEILLLTAGKLTVEEIATRLELKIPEVMKILNRLEQKHLIIYSLH